MKCSSLDVEMNLTDDGLMLRYVRIFSPCSSLLMIPSKRSWMSMSETLTCIEIAGVFFFIALRE